ncbi:hypothetical protein CU669_17370 [Paramagnetospirillum kuznetsovii]|uniref:J domain-containing protein n=1 Tax=Paramagnetospirillum kuznetsovii TaxID=2053833 RepID=A0A364NUL7_9PROT|nr:hypothetical protein [Paramagnetospirillum kuznetsovii]RAU20605.1 hypothetical protein CU669_17370 [Paramagnetospirillum kuznetsovii]
MNEDQSHLKEAAARAERLFEVTGAKGGAEPPARDLEERVEEVRRGLSYWLWRLSGRPAAKPEASLGGSGAMARMARTVDNYAQDLERAREHIATLEARLAEKDRGAELVAAAETRAREAAGRAAEAEHALALANSRIEIQKDALEITKAAAKSGTVADTKFREAKRAFARMYHPDSGTDPARQRLFSEFWPVLERIEREN